MYKEFIEQIVSTKNSWTGLVLRLTLAGVLFPHAVQKLFGWFKGPGLAGEMHYMVKIAGLAPLIAVLAILVECGSVLLLVTGAGTRVAAVGIFGLFLGMIAFIHYPNGFFMNWFGQYPSGKEGFEYHLLVLGLTVGIMLEGGGKFSVDGLFSLR